MGILADHQIRRDVKVTPFSEGTKRSGLISYGLSSYGYDARLGYKGRIFTNTWCGIVDPKNYDPKAFVEVDLTGRKHNWVGNKTRGGSEVGMICTTCSLSIMAGIDPAGYDVSHPCKCGPTFFTVPPNSFMLGESLEHFDVPRDVLCVVVGKSTYARCGIVVNVTPGEPEWNGKWTIEISNTTPLPAKVYAGEGIMQCLFLRTDGLSEAVRKVLQNKLSTLDFGAYNALQDAINKATCETSYADKAGKYSNQKGLTSPRVDGMEFKD